MLKPKIVKTITYLFVYNEDEGRPLNIPFKFIGQSCCITIKGPLVNVSHPQFIIEALLDQWIYPPEVEMKYIGDIF